ncbi:class I SAM-dependent methyltransferase [Perlabentimonas gracilis]|uniref:class I SAM-dependent methyltransferase n=1 Tax=Perlabentimonas gracilis TaxID=2715279 RepID=UPI00140C4A5E|nr:class I SAM-dependent methyltransferase [Perlabentimonas gracilis]NHB69720.1 class I SAM-dependent methyltransferase [Perlabentimonas gracilis]
MAYKNWYDILISPLLSGLTKRIALQIEEGANLLEVGCGTGELASALHYKGVKSYLGVDLTPKMIEAARGKVAHPNFTFIADDFLIININSQFNYAVFSMIIHSVDEELANRLICKAKALSSMIVFADYLVPQPKGFKGFLVKLIERLAGKEHYTNFTYFKSLGGIDHFVRTNKLTIVKQLDYEVFRIVVTAVA